MSPPHPTVATQMPKGDGYLDGLRAQVWDEFARSVVAMLRCAAARVAADHPVRFSGRRGWWGDGVHRVIGHDVRVPLENAVTDALVRTCKQLREERRPNHFMKRKQIFIAQQQPREKQDRLGSDAYTTDIQFASSSVPYLDLRIEAKRLLSGRNVADYLGEDGMMRFAHAEPYTVQPVGMMLGYTFRHDDAHWMTRLGQRWPTAVEALRPIRVGRWSVPGSVVENPVAGDVLVLHLLLPLRTQPDARLLKRKPNRRSGRSPRASQAGR